MARLRSFALAVALAPGALVACALDLAPTTETAPEPSAPAPKVTADTSNDAAPPPRADAEADAGEPCVPGRQATDVGPRAETFSLDVRGQKAFVHDAGKTAGYFHTFDALTVGGGEPHKVHVLLPRKYGESCARYPLVVMNDGHTAFWPGGLANKTFGMAEALADAYARGALREVVVVAVEPVSRNREYTHAPWLTGEACCGAKAYAAWLADGLVPFVDAAYRTQASRDQRFVLGSSHGGLSALYVAGKRPDVFGGAIAMSASLWAGLDDRVSGTRGGPLATSALLSEIGPGLSSATRPKVYLDWGLYREGGTHNTVTEELATTRGRELAGLLVTPAYGYRDGRDLFTVEDPRGEHDETSWGRRLAGALERVVGK
ncbi:MAG: alpha/beta hydrolase [Myxococcales bacterium]|nr:alpha/beta hydrolase [Myxococcales bacterium]